MSTDVSTKIAGSIAFTAVIAICISALASIIYVQQYSNEKDRQQLYTLSNQWAKAGSLYVQEYSRTQALLRDTKQVNRPSIRAWRRIQAEADNAAALARSQVAAQNIAQMDVMVKDWDRAHKILKEQRYHLERHLLSESPLSGSIDTYRASHHTYNLVDIISRIRGAIVAQEGRSSAVDILQVENAWLRMNILREDITHHLHMPHSLSSSEVKHIAEKLGVISAYFQHATSSSDKNMLRAIDMARAAYETLYKPIVETWLYRNMRGEYDDAMTVEYWQDRSAVLTGAIATKMHRMKLWHEAAATSAQVEYIILSAALCACCMMSIITAIHVRGMLPTLQIAESRQHHEYELEKIAIHLQDISADIRCKILEQAGESAYKTSHAAPPDSVITPADSTAIQAHSNVALRHIFV